MHNNLRYDPVFNKGEKIIKKKKIEYTQDRYKKPRRGGMQIKRLGKKHNIRHPPPASKLFAADDL